MKYQIISVWNGSTEDCLQLKKGDIVQLGITSEDSKWKNWRECITNEKSGWVPTQIIMELSNNNGEIIEDYSAYELKANIDEYFVCIKELNGWLYGFIETQKSIYGWIPKEIVKVKEEMITEVEYEDISDLLKFITNYKIENNRTITTEISNNLQKEITEVISRNSAFAYKSKDENGNFCGYLVFHILNFPMINGKEAYITDLFIDKNQRGKGIGQKFLQIAERIARENNCARLMLNNPKEYESYERAFYLKNGYTERINFANFVKDLSK